MCGVACLRKNIIINTALEGIFQYSSSILRYQIESLYFILKEYTSPQSQHNDHYGDPDRLGYALGRSWPYWLAVRNRKILRLSTIAVKETAH